ncbi:MAG: translocation/assembly module TamB domain-containing protein [Candidatus Riflebacteria bacterium]|nr:translocation/assembly module TamB domain-containing protein [Candidatus Riflebacteria bacterium]
MTGATYENHLTGTVLREGAVRARVSGRRLVIKRGSATDGSQGRLALEGWVQLEPLERFPLALQVRLEQVRWVRNDQAEARAGGTLRLSGTAFEPLLSGEVTVGPAEVRLPERLPEDLRVVEFRRVGGPARSKPVAPARGPGPGKWLRLDLDVKVPGRVFVRGRGLAGIAPAQALKLGSALQTVSGGSGGGLMGLARNLVGVDLLNVGQSSTGAAGTALGVGKYLQEGLYVGVEKSLDSGGMSVSIEAELTPELTVETNVDSASRSGVGLNWRREH